MNNLLKDIVDVFKYIRLTFCCSSGLTHQKQYLGETIFNKYCKLEISYYLFDSHFPLETFHIVFRVDRSPMNLGVSQMGLY